MRGAESSSLLPKAPLDREQSLRIDANAVSPNQPMRVVLIARPSSETDQSIVWQRKTGAEWRDAGFTEISTMAGPADVKFMLPKDRQVVFSSGELRIVGVQPTEFQTRSPSTVGVYRIVKSVRTAGISRLVATRVEVRQPSGS